MGKKNKTKVYAAYDRLTSALRTQKLKVKEWKKLCRENGSPPKSRCTYIYIRQNGF